MYNLTIQLQNHSEKCLYEQIYEHIRQEIREGKLLAGERLPSTRSLAEYLQVSRSTVDMAYGQLLSEGYLEARPYKGYFVCNMEELFRLETCRLKEKQDPVTVSYKGDISSSDTENGNRDYVYDFSPNGIDMGAFPFSVWKKITKNVLSDGSNELYALGKPQGDYELRLTISRYLHASRGVNCMPEQIVVGAGNDYLLLLLEKILGRDAKIAMENPTYLRAYRIFRSCGYEIVPVSMDESGMKVSDLDEKRATVAYIMPSHQHPTGLVMPIGRRAELLSWADQKDDRYLIEDDYDSEFRYWGKPIPALQSLDKKGKVIYIGTFSKAIAPAIRVSYMVLPQGLLERYGEACSFLASTVSRIDQRILNEFIRDGYFERHLNKMRKRYRIRHELMVKCLEPFAEHFRLSGENAGLHLLLTATDGREEKMLIRLAAEEQVKVYGLSDSFFGLDAEEENQFIKRPGTVLLGFGGLTEEQIREGTRRLKKAWLS